MRQCLRQMHAWLHRSSQLSAVAAAACALAWQCEAALVEVAFDPAGGALADDLRVVQVGGKYGCNANLYPSDSSDNFSDLPADRITLADGVFYYSTSDRWCNYWTKPIDNIVEGKPYTYVIDVLTYANTASQAPWFNVGQTGGDQPSQLTGVYRQVQGVGRLVLDLSGQEQSGRTTLGRDFIDLNPADGVCSMKFRVQLYAGRNAVPADGESAESGECAAMPLPVPVWTDHVFLGWTNSAGEVVAETSEVTNAANHVLGAMWKEWRIDMSGAERPLPGQPLVASTNYGDDGETGTVSFKWMRGDWEGGFADAAEGAEYVPSEADCERFIKVVLLVDGKALAEKSIWFSRLPVVYIDTSDGQDIVVKSDEKTSDVRIQGNGEFAQQYDGLAFVKGRGNSTWGMPKKPYKVKLDKKTDLFGFGKNKHWVLLANYIDVSSMRNKTAYDMSGAFGLEYMDSTWVEVVFNGRFDGLYQLCEHVRVDKTRVDIFDWEGAVDDEEDLSSVDPAAADITGGYLWELSAEYDEVSRFKIDVTGDGETDEDIPVMFNRPEFAFTNPAMMDWCRSFWQDVHAAWTSPLNETADGSKNWEDLCDIDSMVSYWLVNEIFGNDDAWYKSRYCYKDVGGRLTFGPVWDCDWGLGSVAVGTNDVAQWRLARNNNSGWPVSFYKDWLDDPWFCLKALKKYREMRPKFDALLAGGGGYDASVAYLREAGLAEDERWSAAREESYGANRRTHAEDAGIFKWWMKTRLEWLDTQFAGLDTLMDGVFNHESASPYSRSPGTLTAGGDGVFHVRDAQAASVDVMLNGRVAIRALPLADGACSFSLKPCLRRLGPDSDALVAAVCRRADGTVSSRDHAVLRTPPLRGMYLKLR